MLFHSYVFLYAFLPVVVVGFVLASRASGRGPALAWLLVASLFFYGWWSPPHLLLLLGSVVANYALGSALVPVPGRPPRRALLTAGVAANLAAIGWFKYAGFAAGLAEQLTGASIGIEAVALPLAISFFTFQQIAYLVDCHRGGVGDHGFLHYALFVTFFPQLIAGPIVHHGEVIPQWTRPGWRGLRPRDVSVGATFFVIGLFEKVVLADGISAFATPAFDAADGGAMIEAGTAWTALLAWTFQLYFDFAGYSDMAIGLARLFGVRLPLNFDAPYRATSIIGFWRRWHRTLSRFLRDYLYIPLGGNRRGSARRYANLMITMLLGGLWHGAGWNFVLWGGIHGALLGTNHLFRAWRPGGLGRSASARVAGWALTFGAVVLAWVPFRSETFDGALRFWRSLAGLGSGPSLFVGDATAAWPPLLALLAICLVVPPSHELLRRYRPVLDSGEVRTASPDSDSDAPRWRPTTAYAALTILLFATAVALIERDSEFLYFQF